MGYQLNKKKPIPPMPLTDITVKNAKPKEKQYKLFDGGGLYLLVKPSGSRLWNMKYRFGEKEKVYAIGQYPVVTLAEARDKRLRSFCRYCHS